MVESVENVVRKTRKQINHEPRLQVIESDHFWIGDHLPTRANVSRVKVEYNVYEKYHVDDGVHDKEGDVFWGLVFQCYVVGDHDGCVEGEAENDPVPNGLEGAVM